MTRRARARKKLMSANEKRLTRRYLVWCYKTTKEALDRIDRYFTQSVVDQQVLGQLTSVRDYASADGDRAFRKSVDDLRVYMADKEVRARKMKFRNGNAKEGLTAEYLSLRCRFSAVEKAISVILGKKELEMICAQYEDEMTRRILQAKEH